MRRGKSITLTDGIRNILTEFCKSRRCPVFLNKRSEFILLAAEGVSNKAIAAATGAHFNTVQLWLNRFASEQDRLALIEKQCPSDLKDALTEVLSD